jgi:hypothetical protein
VDVAEVEVEVMEPVELVPIVSDEVVLVEISDDDDDDEDELVVIKVSVVTTTSEVVVVTTIPEEVDVDAAGVENGTVVPDTIHSCTQPLAGSQNATPLPQNPAEPQHHD